MNTLPMGLFERFLTTAFLTTPVMPSPNAMKSDGTMASHGSPTTHQMNEMDVHHIRPNLTSFWFCSVWNQCMTTPARWDDHNRAVSNMPATIGYQTSVNRKGTLREPTPPASM